MGYNRIVISSGHSKHVRGAAGPSPWGLDEVNEARKVVDQLAKDLRLGGVEVDVYHDDVSKTQNENLNRIVDYHNSRMRDLDISCHFNASKVTSNPVGTEVWYKTQEKLACEMSKAIASVGFKDRGAKSSNDLFFLNQTAKPAILLEICFVDSEADAKIYRENFNIICNEMALQLGADFDTDGPVPEVPSAEVMYCSGKCSHFGGELDTGVSPSEGLAFIYEVEDAPHLFMPIQPAGTTGLARRLNARAVSYIACRWDYNQVSKKEMLSTMALVRSVKTGIAIKAFPADWGPNENTGRVADLSPWLMDALGLTTDDEVEVIFPYTE